MSGFFALIARDSRLALRIGGGPWLGLTFFFAIVTLLPLGVGAKLELLGAAASGFLWLGASLATLLSLDRLFQADLEDGSLEEIALADLPLEAAVLAKGTAHWLTTGLPMAAAAPLFGLLLNLPPPAYGPLIIGLLIGTPALSLIGAIGAALTAGLRRGGLLLSLIVLPLYAPIVIFGAGAAAQAADGFDPAQGLLLLAGLSLAALALAPFAAAAALRLHLS